MEQILTNVAKRRSPITGEAFEPLSDKYKTEKKADGLSGVPNLERSGDMLDALDFRLTSDGIELGVYGDAALRADGHNNLSGESDLPLRQFLPNEGEDFTGEIMDQVDKIVAAGRAVDPADLAEVESSSELYDLLSSSLDLTGRSSIRSVVLNDPMLYNMLAEFDLVDLL